MKDIIKLAVTQKRHVASVVMQDDVFSFPEKNIEISHKKLNDILWLDMVLNFIDYHRKEFTDIELERIPFQVDKLVSLSPINLERVKDILASTTD